MSYPTGIFELRQDVLSVPNIINEFEKYIYGIRPQFYEEEIAVWPDMADMKRTLNQIRSYVPDRARYVDFKMRQLRTTPTGDLGTKI